MTIQEAGQVLAVLTAAFPDQALEPEAVAFWANEIALLDDCWAARDAALEIARTRQ